MTNTCVNQYGKFCHLKHQMYKSAGFPPSSKPYCPFAVNNLEFDNSCKSFKRIDTILLKSLEECLSIIRLQNGNLHDDINQVQARAEAAIAHTKVKTMTDIRDNILNTVTDLASSFMYYDRKEDEYLPQGVIEQAIKDGIITDDEIIEAFRKACFER